MKGRKVVEMRKNVKGELGGNEGRRNYGEEEGKLSVSREE